MKEVVLHIGAHKTGTTSIQHALAGYDDGHTKYSSLQKKNHSIPMKAIFEKDFEKNFNWNRMNWRNRREIADYKKNKQAIFHAELRDSRIERLIISGEGICSLSYDEKFNIVNEIQGAKAQVKIIYFARDPNTLVTSMVQQRAKSGQPMRKSVGPQYKNHVGPFLDFLPKENIQVVDYSSIIKKHDLIKYFSDIIGLSLSNTQHRNQSLSRQGLSLVNILNNLPFSTQEKIELFIIRRHFIYRIRKEFSVESGCEKIKHEVFHQLLSINTQEQCNWLRENFEIQYSVRTDHVAEVSIDDYLSTGLNGYEARIKKLLNSLGQEFNSDKTVEENMMNAFLGLVCYPPREILAAVSA